MEKLKNFLENITQILKIFKIFVKISSSENFEENFLYPSMDKQKHMGHKGKLLFWFASFCSKSEFSLHSLRFYLSTEA